MQVSFLIWLSQHTGGHIVRGVGLNGHGTFGVEILEHRCFGERFFQGVKGGLTLWGPCKDSVFPGERGEWIGDLGEVGNEPAVILFVLAVDQNVIQVGGADIIRVVGSGRAFLARVYSMFRIVSENI